MVWIVVWVVVWRWRGGGGGGELRGGFASLLSFLFVVVGVGLVYVEWGRVDLNVIELNGVDLSGYWKLSGWLFCSEHIRYFVIEMVICG